MSKSEKLKERQESLLNKIDDLDKLMKKVSISVVEVKKEKKEKKPKMCLIKDMIKGDISDLLKILQNHFPDKLSILPRPDILNKNPRARKGMKGLYWEVQGMTIYYGSIIDCPKGMDIGKESVIEIVELYLFNNVIVGKVNGIQAGKSKTQLHVTLVLKDTTPPVMAGKFLNVVKAENEFTEKMDSLDNIPKGKYVLVTPPKPIKVDVIRTIKEW